MKLYTFTYEELTTLSYALVEYKHFLRPEQGEEMPEKRARVLKVASALYEQFKDDVRLYKGNV